MFFTYIFSSFIVSTTSEVILLVCSFLAFRSLIASIPDSDKSFIAAALLSISFVLSAVLVILSVSCLTFSTLVSISVAWLDAPEATSAIAPATSPDTLDESADIDDMVSADDTTWTATSRV